MARVILLSAVLSLSPLSLAADAVPADPERGCSRTPPTYVLVFRRHARGSSVPARIDRVPRATYIGRVLASGAMPADRPMEALKAMAAVVQARVHYLRCHRAPGMRWRGRAFDVTDGSRPQWCGTCDHGMFYRAVKVHSRIRRAVSEVRGTLLRRPNGRLRKPQWSGPPAKCGAGIRGNALPGQGAASCARRGYTWRQVLRVYFPKGRITRGGTR